MPVVDTVIYVVLTWYIEEVRSGKNGVAKPLYFPFMPLYWLGQRGRGIQEERDPPSEAGGEGTEG